jgi:DNA-binding transcriptional ArsR family regulator
MPATDSTANHEHLWRLPDDSLLSMDQYVKMQSAVADQTRLQIVAYLADNEDVTPTELRNELESDLDESTFYYHLNKLVDTGLVEKRARNDGDGIHRYYQCSIFGDVLLNHGISELFRREWETRGAYSDDGDRG